MMFSHSKINCYKQCPMMYKYKYVDELEPLDDSEALNIGSAFHRGIELNSSELLAKELDESEYFSDQQNETNKVLALAMVDGFLKKYPHHNEGDIEHEVYLETNVCGEEKDFRMYADAIVHIQGAGLILREYKTASRIDDIYIDKLKFNDQISRYCYCIEKEYNLPVLKIEYYVVKKPQLRQKKDETIEQYRSRLVDRLLEDDSIYYFELLRSKEEIEEARNDLKYDITQIKNTTRFTKNLASCSCYGKCPYISLCCKNEDAVLLYKKREERDVNDITE